MQLIINNPKFKKIRIPTHNITWPKSNRSNQAHTPRPVPKNPPKNCHSVWICVVITVRILITLTPILIILIRIWIWRFSLGSLGKNRRRRLWRIWRKFRCWRRSCLGGIRKLSIWIVRLWLIWRRNSMMPRGIIYAISNKTNDKPASYKNSGRTTSTCSNNSKNSPNNAGPTWPNWTN